MIQITSILKFSGKHPKARGLSAKDTLSSSLGHRSTCVELPGHPDATSCSPPPASWRREGSLETPLAMPRDAPLLSSFPWRPPSSPCFLLVTCKQRHGRHLAPPSHALPSPADVLRRSGAPSSTSPLKESSRRALNRRRSRRFLTRNRGPPPPNLMAAAVLRPSRPHRRVPGENPVRPPPFPLLLPRRSRRHGWSPAMPMSRSAWAVAQPTRPAWRAYVARALSVSFRGSKDPG
jgi:hypothetical protein